MTRLGDLWAEHHEDIEKYICRKFRLNPRDAEEVVAQAAVRLINGPDATKDLLRLMALNLAINLVNQRKRRAELDAEISPLYAGQVHMTIEGAMFRADFDRAFRRLPTPEAEAFALIELRGLTVRETAEVTGVPRQTIQRRCEAARNFLKEALA